MIICHYCGKEITDSYWNEIQVHCINRDGLYLHCDCAVNLSLGISFVSKHIIYLTKYSFHMVTKEEVMDAR